MQRFTAREYLKIDIANSFGLDKLDWDDRIAWFNANESTLHTKLADAAEPALYYAGVNAWNTVQQGEPSGYPISLDATASGLQLLAVLTGDRKAAEICNVVDTGHRRDAYTSVYQNMLAKTGDISKITREDTKSAIMKALYGSTAEPKRVFGEGALLRHFYDTVEELTPGAWELNTAFLHMWDPTAYKYSWVLPDNFHVHVKVMRPVIETVNFLDEPFEITTLVNAPIERGRALAANLIHSLDGLIVREMVRRCSYDPKKIKQIGAWLDDPYERSFISTKDDKIVVKLWENYKISGYLSARILDHLAPRNFGHINRVDIKELIQNLPSKPFQVLTVHDCFRCLPAYGNDLRTQYNDQLHLIAKSNMLNYLLSQLIGRKINVKQLDPYLFLDIAQANYALS